MKTKECILEEIEKINKSKQILIRQYFQAQNSNQISFEQKLRNTKNIFYELQQKNDEITKLECELVSSISFEI